MKIIDCLPHDARMTQITDQDYDTVQLSVFQYVDSAWITPLGRVLMIREIREKCVQDSPKFLLLEKNHKNM